MISGIAIADPIEGYWVYYLNQKPKYIVSITNGSQGYSGQLVAGSKRYNGKTVLTGLKSQGNGNYSGGYAYSPIDGGKYNANLTLNGNVLTMRAFKGLPTFGLNYTFKRLPPGYTFATVD